MNNYLLLQIIVSVIVLVIIKGWFDRFKKQAVGMWQFIGWLVLWIGVAVVFWLPQTASYLAFNLGIGRGVDLAVYCSILLIFYLLFKIFLRLDKQQSDLTKVVRYVAIKEAVIPPKEESTDKM